MFKVSNTESKVTPRRKNITISYVSIEGDTFVDEEGSIAERLLDELPDGVNEFKIRITIDMPEEI